jgi:hypothetical protein
VVVLEMGEIVMSVLLLALTEDIDAASG